MKNKTVAVDLGLMRYLAKLNVVKCPWCADESWYGADHTSSCPITAARNILEVK